MGESKTQKAKEKSGDKRFGDAFIERGFRGMFYLRLSKLNNYKPFY